MTCITAASQYRLYLSPSPWVNVELLYRGQGGPKRCFLLEESLLIILSFVSSNLDFVLVESPSFCPSGFPSFSLHKNPSSCPRRTRQTGVADKPHSLPKSYTGHVPFRIPDIGVIHNKENILIKIQIKVATSWLPTYNGTLFLYWRHHGIGITGRRQCKGQTVF